MQLLFYENIAYFPASRSILQNASIRFVPFILPAYMSFSNLHLCFFNSINSVTLSASVGLYSLTGSTLTLVNSVTGSVATTAAGVIFCDLSATSAASNLSPGNWWFGLLLSNTKQTSISIQGNCVTINPFNAFPGNFIGGIMTESTTALPASIETSALDITGADALFQPYILLN